MIKELLILSGLGTAYLALFLTTSRLVPWVGKRRRANLYDRRRCEGKDLKRAVRIYYPLLWLDKAIWVLWLVQVALLVALPLYALYFLVCLVRWAI